MVLVPVVETSSLWFGCFLFFSLSTFMESDKEKGSTETEEDRWKEISDPSNNVVCLSLLDMCNSVCTAQFYDRKKTAEEKCKE